MERETFGSEGRDQLNTVTIKTDQTVWIFLRKFGCLEETLNTDLYITSVGVDVYIVRAAGWRSLKKRESRWIFQKDLDRRTSRRDDV